MQIKKVRNDRTFPGPKNFALLSLDCLQNHGNPKAEVRCPMHDIFEIHHEADPHCEKGRLIGAIGRSSSSGKRSGMRKMAQVLEKTLD